LRRPARLTDWAAQCCEGWFKTKGVRDLRKFHPVYLCLLIPYAVWAWVPFYNRLEPSLFGIPFFYWWQVCGIFLTAGSILPVYLYEERRK
jgi:hypothetical protein